MGWPNRWGRPLGWLRSLVSVAAAALCVATVPAQQTKRFDAGDREDVIEVEWLSSVPTQRDGGMGWLRAVVENKDDRGHGVDLGVASYEHSRLDTSFRRTISLDAGERRTVDLPFPAMSDLGLEVTVDAGSRRLHRLAEPEGNLGVLLVEERDDDSLEGLEDVLRGLDRGSVEPWVLRREPEDLPGQWSWLSGFDVVVLDGDADGMDDDILGVVLRFVRAGGVLLVRNVGELEGDRGRALAEQYAMARREREGAVAYGMGTILTPPRGWSPRKVIAWTDEVGIAAGLASRQTAGAFPSHWRGQLSIPGLGGVPLGMFFLLVLAFAILVGPVNLWLLRRGRRPTYLVVTVPLLGLGFTLAILLWGTFREGFGIRGAVTTVTVLDQGEHEAVTLGHQVLFAGIGPALLEPQRGTSIYSSRETDGRRERPPGYRFDLDRGTLDGMLVRSRKITELGVATVGVSRPRLSFVSTGDGMDVVVAEDLRPVDGSAMVVCDPDGTTFLGEFVGGRARLEPVDDPQALVGVVASLANVSLIGERRLGPSVVSRLLERLMGDGLPASSYLMLVERPPLFDDMGLEVEWLDRQHLVHGMCTEEDFRG